MRNLKFSMLAVLALFAVNASAAIHPYYQDIKLPTQSMVEHQQIVNPAAAGTADILSAHAGNTSAAAATASTFVAQPDVPRNLVVTPGGTTADVARCNLVVSGTNIFGAAMSETIFVENNQANASVGALAFKTVSSVVFPANCEDGGFAATWSIGYGEKLGVKRCMDAAGAIFFSLLNNAKEATAPTMAVGANASVAGTTADFVGTMNGTNDFDLFFVQNFRCLP